MSTLRQEIEKMSEQQIAKLSREIQEFIKMFDNPKEYPNAFPILRWLFKKLQLEATIAETVRKCPMCARDVHKLHTTDYIDIDNKVWLCRCKRCVGRRSLGVEA